MRLIIDNREHALYEKCELIITNNPGYTTVESAVLPIGDILVKTDEGKDVMIVERKTLADLLASIKDGRYEEQSHRLKYASGFPAHNVVYIIEGMLSTLRTFMEKKLVISAIASLNYFKGFSVFRTSGVQETADTLIYMADKIDRNFMKGILPSYLLPDISNTFTPNQLKSEAKEDETRGEAKSEAKGEAKSEAKGEAKSEAKGEAKSEAKEAENPTGGSESQKSYSGFVKTIKKENITQENIGEIMLCQIPGISSIYAQAILKFFGGFSKMIELVKLETAKFDDISYETKGKMRRIPKTCGEQIKKFVAGI
jgi:ERCC4-type nuclease